MFLAEFGWFMVLGCLGMFGDVWGCLGMFGVYHIWWCQSGHANAGALWHFSWWWPHRSHSWGEIWATARASYGKEMGSPSIIMFHDIHVMFHHVQTCFSFLSKNVHNFDSLWLMLVHFDMILYHHVPRPIFCNSSAPSLGSDLREDAMTIRKAVVQCQELSKSGKLQDFFLRVER